MSGAVEGVALLPCPFCGAAEDVLSNAGELYSYRVVCEVCNAEGPSTEFSPKVQGSFAAASGEARAAWNTRTTPPARSYADAIEDAAKVADDLAKTAASLQAALELHGVDAPIKNAQRETATSLAVAIRLLSQGGKA